MLIWNVHIAPMMTNSTNSEPFAFLSEQVLLDKAMGCIYYYNNVREHSSLDYQTPLA